MSRFNAKVRCNYYPLPRREAERIRNLLQFPVEPFSALDPCVGDGAAFATITQDSSARRYGIELDAYRAEQAGPSLTTVSYTHLDVYKRQPLVFSALAEWRY